MDTPIWSGADAVTNLINNGMDLFQREPLNNGTILHHWAGTPYVHRNSNQGDSLAVVKLLIEKDADLLLAINSWGFTPLLEAATGRDGECPNLVVLDLFLERDEYSRVEKIEAMELAGAMILGNFHINLLTHLFPNAFDYWRKALQLRQMDAEGSDHIQKTILSLKTVCTTEWTISEELEEIIEHPETYMIQSFLVRLRIFSFRSWKAVENMFSSCIKKFGFVHYRIRTTDTENRTVKIFDIIWAMLETLCQCDPFEEHGIPESLTKRVIENIILLLSCSPRDFPDYFTEKITKTSLELVLFAIRLHRIKMHQLIPLVNIFLRLPQISSNANSLKALSEFCDHCGQTLLHFVCNSGDVYFGNLYARVRLLLNAGCDPNAIDENGNAPLHYLAQLEKRVLSDWNNTAHLLLDFGAQLSLKNLDGKTAIDVWIEKHEEHEIPDWCSELPNLKCLCARLIRRNKILYLELPATLIPMIEKHKMFI